MYIFETKTFEKAYNGINFVVKLQFEEEDISISDIFDYTDEELKEIYCKLDRYELVYFCAHMQAYFNNIHLSDDYLGCCLYDSYDRFVDDDDYFGDMVNNVLTEGYKELKRIREQLNGLQFEDDDI